MAARKQEMITFKADGALLAALRGVPNRSAFIREALFAALGGTCPLCRGTGMLSTRQREHWEEFSNDHAVEECDDCHEFRIVCAKDAACGKRRGR